MSDVHEQRIPRYGLGNIGPDSIDERDRPLYSHQEIDRIVSSAQSGTDGANGAASKATTGKSVIIPNLPPVYDQGRIGSCTSNAVLAALRYAEFKHGVKYEAFLPSRMFLYRNARLRIDPEYYNSTNPTLTLDEQLKTDTGGYCRTNIVSLLMDGVCTEDMWPYVRADITESTNSKGQPITVFSNIKETPNPIEPKDLGAAQFQAKNSSHPRDPQSFSGKKDLIPRAISYYRIYDERKNDTAAKGGVGIWQWYTQPSIALLEETLQQGWPFLFGISFELSVNLWNSVKDGVLADPPSNFTEKSGHTMLAVGFDSEKKRFLVQNSWGPTWGQEGRVWIPYAYFGGSFKKTVDDKVYTQPMTYDYWVIKTAEVKN